VQDILFGTGIQAAWRHPPQKTDVGPWIPPRTPGTFTGAVDIAIRVPERIIRELVETIL
jgi:hypothetical protein